MKAKRLRSFISILYAVSGCVATTSSGSPRTSSENGHTDKKSPAIILPREQQGTVSAHNENAVLEYLRPALRSVGGSCRLYYSAPCYAEDGDPLPFPALSVQPPAKRKNGVSVVREIFKNDHKVDVATDRSGIITIRIGAPPSELLRTRIPLLTLKPQERYNAIKAIVALTKTKEVEAAERKLGLKEPLVIMGLLEVEPKKGLPHLPSSLRDVTVDQALDVVAKTFKGIVLYGACADPSGERLYFLDFVDVVPLYTSDTR